MLNIHWEGRIGKETMLYLSSVFFCPFSRGLCTTAHAPYGAVLGYKTGLNRRLIGTQFDGICLRLTRYLLYAG